jgi:hypothetical protein
MMNVDEVSYYDLRLRFYKLQLRQQFYHVLTQSYFS